MLLKRSTTYPAGKREHVLSQRADSCSTTLPSDISCFHAAYPLSSAGTTRCGSRSHHRIPDSATFDPDFLGTSPYLYLLWIPGYRSCSYGIWCGSAYRGFSAVYRGNLRTQNRNGPARFPPARTGLSCAGSSHPWLYSRDSISCEIPADSGCAFGQGNGCIIRSSSRRERSESAPSYNSSSFKGSSSMMIASSWLST